MATPPSVQRLPSLAGAVGEVLPFYSRYQSSGCGGVDVLTLGVPPFFRIHHQRGKEVFTFKRWKMRAVEVDFTVDEIVVLYHQIG